MSTFAESARDGDALATALNAFYTGASWAIAVSWANSIRAIVTALLPQDTIDQVLAELAAAGITTFFAVTISICIARTAKFVRVPRPSLSSLAPPTAAASIASSKKRPRLLIASRAQHMRRPTRSA